MTDPIRQYITRIEERVLRWLQRRCDHPADQVVADLLQRDNLPTMVTWCRVCGAVAVNNENERKWREMRRPEALR